MKFVVNYESEAGTKRTKALTWKEAHDLIIKELNESKNVLDFNISRVKGDNDMFYKLASFKRQTGIFTETVTMSIIR